MKADLNFNVDKAVNRLLDDSRLDVIRPGDTLLLRVNRSCDAAQAWEVKARLEAQLPNVTVVVINADQIAVYRPEGEA